MVAMFLRGGGRGEEAGPQTPPHHAASYRKPGRCSRSPEVDLVLLPKDPFVLACQVGHVEVLLGRSWSEPHFPTARKTREAPLAQVRGGQEKFPCPAPPPQFSRAGLEATLLLPANQSGRAGSRVGFPCNRSCPFVPQRGQPRGRCAGARTQNLLSLGNPWPGPACMASDLGANDILV